ncbi:MAG TPA: Holliday junction resolvase-like protein [Ignavibacteriaceae bacterium]|nr:Holliday junction resolvase-like protein [Ignavibacteriaceae bacterium]
MNSPILEFPFYKPFILQVVLTDGWIIFLTIFILVAFYILITEKNDLKKRLTDYVGKVKEKEVTLKEQELIFNKKEAELKVSYQNWALTELEKFKNTEISNAANVMLQKWKIENEAAIRQDAINRSYSVNLGKITEHLIPFHINFPFNPKDARFIGSPIDMIVFDGHSDNKEDIIIYIVEIKTGNSKLTEIQKKIKEATINGNIRWYEINPDIEDVESQTL